MFGYNPYRNTYYNGGGPGPSSDPYLYRPTSTLPTFVTKPRPRSAYFGGAYSDYSDPYGYGGYGYLSPGQRAHLEAKKRREVMMERERERIAVEEERRRRMEEEYERERMRKRRVEEEEEMKARQRVWGGRGTQRSDPVQLDSLDGFRRGLRQQKPPATKAATSSNQPQATSPIPTPPSSQPTASLSSSSFAYHDEKPIRVFVSTPELDEAARKIQNAFRARRALRTIHTIEARFEELKRGYVQPKKVDFDTPRGVVTIDVPDVLLNSNSRMHMHMHIHAPPLENDENDENEEDQRHTPTPPPRLAYTSNNVPLHAFVEALNRLLVQLDGVESWGVRRVREGRRRVVGRVEGQAARVEEWWRGVWEGRGEEQGAEGAKGEEQAVKGEEQAAKVEEQAVKGNEVDPEGVPDIGGHSLENQHEGKEGGLSSSLNLTQSESEPPHEQDRVDAPMVLDAADDVGLPLSPLPQHHHNEDGDGDGNHNHYRGSAVDIPSYSAVDVPSQDAVGDERSLE